MAMLKVKLRPSRVKGRSGIVCYQITHRRKTQLITTDIHLQETDWDSVGERVFPAAADGAMLQDRIDGGLSLLRRIIKGLDDSGVSYTVGDIVRQYKSPACQVSVLDFMRGQIAQLKKANRLGTARNYEKTLNSLSAFLNGSPLSFAGMTEQLIGDYNAFLVRRGIVRNSISFYMRILRAVYNKAVRLHLAAQTAPFESVYTGIDRTRKRAVSESVIVQLHRLDLPEHSQLALARDLFVFSYCTRGMAFVDMAYLRRSSVQGDVICYSRRKTGRLLTIRIEPCIRRIIDRYGSPGQPYVFPVLSSEDPAEAYRQYQVSINHYNRQLGKLSEMLPSACKLTSYVARHSWATAARNHDVPISVISAGMGHASEHTTQIYLTMLENSVIDTANRGILAAIE